MDQAIQIARRHRDQLIRGVQLLESLPSEGPTKAMHSYSSRWTPRYPTSVTLPGDTIFQPAVPEKLDDYHAASYERFHLIKMLQMPPSGDGRYVMAGRYVSATQELGLLMNI